MGGGWGVDPPSPWGGPKAQIHLPTFKPPPGVWSHRAKWMYDPQWEAGFPAGSVSGAKQMPEHYNVVNVQSSLKLKCHCLNIKWAGKKCTKMGATRKGPLQTPLEKTQKTHRFGEQIHVTECLPQPSLDLPMNDAKSAIKSDVQFTFDCFWQKSKFQIFQRNTNCATSFPQMNRFLFTNPGGVLCCKMPVVDRQPPLRCTLASV